MMQMNLLPWRENQRVRARAGQRRILFAVMLSALGVVLLFNAQVSHRLAFQQQRQQRLAAAMTSLAPSLARIRTLKKDNQTGLLNLMAIRQWTQQSLTMHQLFNALDTLLPASLYLNAIEQHNGVWTLEGDAAHNEDIAELMARMAKQKWIEASHLSEIKHAPSSAPSIHMHQFTVDFKYRWEGGVERA